MPGALAWPSQDRCVKFLSLALCLFLTYFIPLSSPLSIPTFTVFFSLLQLLTHSFHSVLYSHIYVPLLSSFSIYPLCLSLWNFSDVDRKVRNKHNSESKTQEKAELRHLCTQTGIQCDCLNMHQSPAVHGPDAVCPSALVAHPVTTPVRTETQS